MRALLISATVCLALATAAEGHDLPATVVSVPPSQGMAAADSYQSSNSEVLWMSTYGETFPDTYGYNPATKSFLSLSGLSRNSNHGHLSQCYYDGATNTVVELDGGGNGPYHLVSRTLNGTVRWDNSGYVVTRNVVGGVGVVDGTIVLLHHQSGHSGDGYIVMDAFDIQTGATIYHKQYWQQTRCNPNTGICVSIGDRLNEVSFVGFHAATGTRAWTLHNPPNPGASWVISSIYDDFVVMSSSSGTHHSINTTDGTFLPIAIPTGVSKHHRGPNLITSTGSGKHIHAYSISTGLEIVSADSMPLGTTFLGNEQVIVLNAGGLTSQFSVYDAKQGTRLWNVTLAADEIPSSAPASPFLVGTLVVIPYNSSAYVVVDGSTGAKSWGGRHAALLSSNVVYNKESTLVYSRYHVVQFDVEARRK